MSQTQRTEVAEAGSFTMERKVWEEKSTRSTVPMVPVRQPLANGVVTRSRAADAVHAIPRSRPRKNYTHRMPSARAEGRQRAMQAPTAARRPFYAGQ